MAIWFLLSLTIAATAAGTAPKTPDNMILDEALRSGKPVVVKLGTDKCAPCRVMNKIIAEMGKERAGKEIYLSLDVYANRELAQKAGVRVIPSILFYDKKGEPKAKYEGVMERERILKAIDELGLNR